MYFEYVFYIVEHKCSCTNSQVSFNTLMPTEYIIIYSTNTIVLEWVTSEFVTVHRFIIKVLIADYVCRQISLYFSFDKLNSYIINICFSITC